MEANVDTWTNIAIILILLISLYKQTRLHNKSSVFHFSELAIHRNYIRRQSYQDNMIINSLIIYTIHSLAMKLAFTRVHLVHSSQLKGPACPPPPPPPPPISWNSIASIWVGSKNALLSHADFNACKLPLHVHIIDLVQLTFACLDEMLNNRKHWCKNILYCWWSKGNWLNTIMWGQKCISCNYLHMFISSFLPPVYFPFHKPD